MASYDFKAILGEKLKRLTDKTLKSLVDCMCTVAASLCGLDKRVSALENVELPEGGYKPMQEPVASPSANGTAVQFIESMSQDATGRMTATKKTVQDGTTSQKGVVQLEDSTSSTSTTKAATPNSVKSAYDLANTANTGLANKLDKTGDGKDVTVSFSEASARENIGTGEKLSVIFGKIKKWFSDLKALAFKDTVSDSDISGTISDSHIANASTWNGKADKASSGNGMLAVIDASGNFVSSGITAYNQSAVNSLVSNLEAYAGRGQYVHTSSVTIETSTGHEGKLFSFTNLRTGITVLDIGIELAGEDLNSLQFYLPISSSEANEWIWETQTPGVPIAVAEVWSTRGMLTMSPTPGNSSVATHSETRIDAYNGTAPDAALISMRRFGSINVGPSGSAYDAFSKVNATLLLRNTVTNAFAFVDLSVGVSHYANNSPYPKIWGIATCISDGIA